MFIETVCRTVCPTGVYNFIGQYLWPQLLNQATSVMPYVIGAAVLVGGTAAVCYGLSARNNEEKEAKPARALDEPAPATVLPVPTSKVDTKRKKNAAVRFQLPAPVPAAAPAAAISIEMDVTREDTPVDTQSMKAQRQAAVQAFATHAERLGEILQEGVPQRKELQETEDDSDLNITEKMFVAMYLRQYPNPSIKTRHALLQGRQQALKEVFFHCAEALGIPEIRDLQDMPKSVDGKAIIRRAYDQLKPKSKPL